MTFAIKSSILTLHPTIDPANNRLKDKATLLPALIVSQC